MRRKIVSIIIASIVLIGSFYFQTIKVKPNRYQQHLQEKIQKTISINKFETLDTYLPVIVIDYKEENNLEANIEYFEGQESEQYTAQINVIEELASTSKKHSYQISDIKTTIDEESYGVWVLDGMQEDSTLMRNYIGYTLAGQMSLQSPRALFCEVVVEGEYKGIYLLTEKTNDGKEPPDFLDESISFTKATPYMIGLSIIDEKNNRQLSTFRDYTGRKGMIDGAEQVTELIYPDSTLTEKQTSYIEQDISRFEKALASFDSAHLEYGYPNFLDIASFIDYYVLNEWMMNTQAMRNNTFMYKNVDEKLEVIASDFNNSFRKDEQGKSVVNNMIMSDIYWYHYLVKDEQFVSEVIERYEELRTDILSMDKVIELIDGAVTYLEPAIEREYILMGNKDAKASYKQEIEQLKKIIMERTTYLDENIDSLRSEAHYSINKQFKHIEEK